MPFRHPERSHDLGTRIEMEVRERLEEALDYVCLDVLVRCRRAQGLPPPAADSAADRAAYESHVRALLRRLAAELPLADGAGIKAEGDDAASLDAQVRLARTMPDYWQRFETISDRFIAEHSGEDAAAAGPASGGQGPGAAASGSVSSGQRSGATAGGERRRLLARLFGRG